jgi:hypothetical protein
MNSVCNKTVFMRIIGVTRKDKTGHPYSYFFAIATPARRS